MSLAAGTRLGPYEILAPLGAGGMGEVYRARDTRLDRSVALKVLSSALTTDPDLRERFDREARAISAAVASPHLHACTTSASSAGTAYLVMELLGGETLAARLGKGALPLEEALTIAIQIAGALDNAAHRHGIVHRDLTPGNVMLTKTRRQAARLRSRESERAVDRRPGAVDAADDAGEPHRSRRRSSAPFSTWRPSSSMVVKPTPAATSLRLARCSTKC